MILVVTPYITPIQGNELELSIRCWEKYFKANFKRVVIGDIPRWANKYPEVEWIALPRIKQQPGQYHPHLDHAMKFNVICNRFAEYGGFIRVADDCFPVNDFTLRDVMELKYQSKEIVGNESSSRNSWKHDKWKTGYLLRHRGLPTRNFTIHSPMWYDMTRLKQLISQYDLIHNSYVIEDLYFNTYHPTVPAVLLDYTDPYRGIVGKQVNNGRRASIDSAFREICTEKKWFFVTNEGWNSYLEQLIESRLNAPSGSPEGAAISH